jgi:hypothetical protein
MCANGLAATPFVPHEWVCRLPQSRTCVRAYVMVVESSLIGVVFASGTTAGGLESGAAPCVPLPPLPFQSLAPVGRLAPTRADRKRAPTG